MQGAGAAGEAPGQRGAAIIMFTNIVIDYQYSFICVLFVLLVVLLVVVAAAAAAGAAAEALGEPPGERSAALGLAPSLPSRMAARAGHASSVQFTVAAAI